LIAMNKANIPGPSLKSSLPRFSHYCRNVGERIMEP
jgi:hypothetical protein